MRRLGRRKECLIILNSSISEGEQAVGEAGCSACTPSRLVTCMAMSLSDRELEHLNLFLWFLAFLAGGLHTCHHHHCLQRREARRLLHCHYLSSPSAMSPVSASHLNLPPLTPCLMPASSSCCLPHHLTTSSYILLLCLLCLASCLPASLHSCHVRLFRASSLHTL